MIQQNIRTFSYEFGSIIRDIGSVFGSIMDTIVRMTVSGLANKKRLDIRDYREWLIDNLPEIHLTSFEMSIMRSNRYVMPFSMFNDPCSKKISWWVTYNALKHSDIDAYKLGNLGYAIFGLSALAGLICTMYEGNIARYVTIFHDFGYREPIDELKKQLFVYQKD